MLTGANKSQGHKVPRTMAATLAPNVGHEMFRGLEMSKGYGLNDRLLVEHLAAPDDSVLYGSGNVYLSHEQTVRFENTGLTHEGQEAFVCPKSINCYEPSLSRLPSSRIWRVDSKIEKVHDRPPKKMACLGLHLDYSPPLPAVARTITDSVNLVPKHEMTVIVGQGRNNVPDQKLDVSKERQSRSRVVPYSTADQHEDHKGNISLRSTERSISRTKQPGRSNDRHRKKREPSRPIRHYDDRHGSASQRPHNDRLPPSSDDDSTDSSDNPERRNQYRRPSRLRRRNDPSPDDGDSSDDGGSSEKNDRLETTRAGSNHFRIKLQTFDGTGLRESWWAHFKNCASYNRWYERDKLAFLKRALTGNAA